MIKMMKVSAVIVFSWVLVGFAAFAHAQSVNDIISSGKVKIGVNAGAPPFSMIDGNGETVGYDVDTAHLLASYLGVEAEIFPYTAAARIPALESNKVDIVVATLSPTPARAQAVMFTMPYSTFHLVILAANDSKIASMEDLGSSRVGVARGTPQEVTLDKMAPENTTITKFEDDSTTMQALMSGQVDAIAIPETVYMELKKARPEIAIEPKFTLFNQYMSIAVRKDAFELRQWLNTTLSFIKQSGELDDIAVKWTGKKLPSTMPIF